MARAIAIFGWLGAAWLLCSGHTDPLLLSFGLLSCLAVVALSVRMDLVDPESGPYHLWLRIPRYLPWLLWEIVRSNFHIARVILSPSLPIQPRLLRIRATQETELGNAMRHALEHAISRHDHDRDAINRGAVYGIHAAIAYHHGGTLHQPTRRDLRGVAQVSGVELWFPSIVSLKHELYRTLTIVTHEVVEVMVLRG